MPDKPKKYVDVLLPVSVPKLYTYEIPDSLTSQNLLPGLRVCVQFGRRKLYSGLIINIHNQVPKDYQVKPIMDFLDNYPIIKPWQYDFWKWIAEYYMCTTGEVFNAAIPSGLRPEGKTRIFIEEEFMNSESFTDSTQNIIDILSNNPGITIEELQNLTAKKNLLPELNNLVNLKIIAFEEFLKEKTKPKTVEFIQLHSSLKHQLVLNELLNKAEKRAPKQYKAILSYIELSGYYENSTWAEVKKADLTTHSGISSSVINSLILKEIFTVIPKEISRIEFEHIKPAKIASTLNPQQDKALQEISDGFCQKNVVLLHGITSSGKTELYIHLIKEQIKKGKQVLYLLPEIALTAQIISRLQDVFGNKVGIYHSKFNDAERVEVWQNLLGKSPAGSTNYSIVLGVRSSIFLPFDNLGLIIVDEEHENTYKQFDPAPRYHARDTAIMLASIHNAKVLLGSATPSIESYYNSKTDRYQLVGLYTRHLSIELPEIEVIDIKRLRKQKKMKGHFSPQLIDQIKKALDNTEQVILFQNRRGFSPYLECGECAWIPTCIYCDVSLTYHKNIDKLICHYCGYTQSYQTHCKACGSTQIETRGFGTQKVEDDISIMFPSAKVARMDYDTTRRKKSYEELIDRFESGQIDILIGTQMVSKGLDFGNVSLVGILNADSMLNYPDFRAYERSFQLMAQVSGRAGRRNKRGKVIIQSSNPENAIIKQVVDNNYDLYFNQQLQERKTYNYPPYCRILSITLKHKMESVVNKASIDLAIQLRDKFINRVLGPESPVIGRIQNLYIKQILLKFDKDKNIPLHKSLIYNICEKMKSKPGFSSLQINFDVDPY